MATNTNTKVRVRSKFRVRLYSKNGNRIDILPGENILDQATVSEYITKTIADRWSFEVSDVKESSTPKKNEE